MIREFLAGGKFFVAGAICFLAANIPNVYGALVHGKTAPMGFLLLIQLGLIVKTRNLQFQQKEIFLKLK